MTHYDLMGRPYPDKQEPEEPEPDMALNPCPYCKEELCGNEEGSIWECWNCEKTFYKNEDGELEEEE